MKRCGCKIHEGDRELPLTMFHRNSQSSDGLSPRCKECTKKIQQMRYADATAGAQARQSSAKYYQQNKASYVARAEKKYSVDKLPMTMLSIVRCRARDMNIPFDLSVEDIVVPDRCPVLNIPLVHSGKGRTYNTPSVDRIDSTKGYVKGNVVVVSWRANRLKYDASLEELRMLYEFYCKVPDATDK